MSLLLFPEYLEEQLYAVYPQEKPALQWVLGSLFNLICFSLSFSSLPYPQDSLYYMWSMPYAVKSMEIPVPSTVLGGQL